MSNLTAPFTVTFALTGSTWSEPYFTIERARRAVACFSDQADFIGATIRNHAGKVVA